MNRRTSLGGSFGKENSGGALKASSVMPGTAKRMSVGGGRLSLAPGVGSKRMSMGLGLKKESVGMR
jgi:hypothetical protein